MYCPKAHRQLERKQCRELLEGGEGWHAYVIDKAAKLEKDEPVIHRGLLAEVRQFIENARVKV